LLGNFCAMTAVGRRAEKPTVTRNRRDTLFKKNPMRRVKKRG
jgi:hypothetical protein